MPDLVSPPARLAMSSAHPGPAASEVEVLERELGSPRRLVAAVLAVAAGVVGTLFCAAGVESDGVGLLLVTWGPGVLLALLGVLLGVAVLRAGAAVVAAYVASAGATAGAAPGTLVSHLLSGRGLLRSALSAICLVGLLFGLTCLYLGLAGSDPGDLGDGRAAVAVVGLGWSISLGVPGIALLSAQLRASRAAGQRVARGRAG